MIVATAGHVDHGKTSLVRALTGVDATSGPEAQQRGMTIDLGFAQAPAGARVGAGAGAEAEAESGSAAVDFIDVPGHARFLRNTLAGLACVDVALLVIAADDGPMPQTHEHLAILGLLGVPHCLVALSKVDRVTPQRLAAARAEVAALLAGGPYAGAPVLPVATPSGAGLAALHQHLWRLQQAVLTGPAADGGAGQTGHPSQTGRPSLAGHFRLSVDRSFLQTGAGRIVTGAVLSGQVRVGDALLLAPHGSPVRVRGLQVQHQATSHAVAGQRCALILAGAALHNTPPVRGDWLLAPAAHAPTTRLDVWLHNLPTSPLAHRATLQLHLGAAVRNARLALLSSTLLAPGASGLAQLVLDRPVAAFYGDRFILRDGAAGSTVAGGWVIDPFGPERGRSRPDRLARLAAQQPSDASTALAGLLAVSPLGLDLQRFVLARNLAGTAAAALHTSSSLRQVITTPGRGAWAVSTTHWQALDDKLVAALAAHHAAQPDHAGSSQAELASTLGLRSAPALLHALLAARLAAGTLLRQGLRHHLPGHQPVLPAEAEALLARISAVLQPAGLRPPIVGELATQLGLPLPDLLEVLHRAHQLGRLVRVAPNRYYLPDTVNQLAGHAQDLAAESLAAAGLADSASPDTTPEITPATTPTTTPGFDAAAYRDRTGIGRNLTVQVLEFLDAAGLTRFDGKQRHWRQ